MAQALSSSPPDTMPPLMDVAMLREAQALMGARFASILSYYVEDTAEALEDLQPLLEGDVSASRRVGYARIAHSIGSCSREFGFAAMEAAAKALEQGCLHHRPEAELQARLQALLAQWERLRVALEDAQRQAAENGS